MSDSNKPSRDIRRAKTIYKVDKFDNKGVQEAFGWFLSSKKLQVITNRNWKILATLSSRTAYFESKSEAETFHQSKDESKWIQKTTNNQE